MNCRRHWKGHGKNNEAERWAHELLCKRTLEKSIPPRATNTNKLHTTSSISHYYYIEENDLKVSTHQSQDPFSPLRKRRKQVPLVPRPSPSIRRRNLTQSSLSEYVLLVLWMFFH